MISILLPSRNRPRNISRFIDSFYQNSRGEIEFLFYIDECDKLSIPELEYQKEQYDSLVNIRWLVGKRQAISNTYNELYKLIDNPDILLISGDDVQVQTPGWDLLIKEAFSKYNDRLVLVGGSDLFNESLFTTFCLSKEFVEISGFLMPEGYWDYADTTIWDIFSRINRIEKINAIFEHFHPAAKKQKLTVQCVKKICYAMAAMNQVM